MTDAAWVFLGIAVCSSNQHSIKVSLLKCLLRQDHRDVPEILSNNARERVSNMVSDPWNGTADLDRGFSTGIGVRACTRNTDHEYGGLDLGNSDSRSPKR